MDYPMKRMHGWMARFYASGRTTARFWVDETHGGAADALRKAITWRDAERRRLGPRPLRPSCAWRTVRAEYDRLCGYLADAARWRYFSNRKCGKSGGAKRAAEAWLRERRQIVH
jgi:hypothetical protein